MLTTGYVEQRIATYSPFSQSASHVDRPIYSRHDHVMIHADKAANDPGRSGRSRTQGVEASDGGEVGREQRSARKGELSSYGLKAWCPS